MDDLKWLFGIMLLLFFVWFATGGVGRDSSQGGPFIRPPAPVDTGEIYGPQIGHPPEELPTLKRRVDEAATKREIAEEIQRVREEVSDVEKALEDARAKLNVSPYVDLVTLSRGTATRSKVAEEYLEIAIAGNASEDIPLTGWRIRSTVTGGEATIGKASPLPSFSGTETVQDIFVRPGGRIYVVTGRSPKGVSFRLNSCTGYFEQFQDFSPTLPRECPLVSESALPKAPNNLRDDCLDLIDRIPRCETPLTLPLWLDQACRDFIQKEAVYKTCVEKYKSETDFYKNTWYVYLGRDEELWKERREVIELLDRADKLIDVISY